MTDDAKLNQITEIFRSIRDFPNKCFYFWGWMPNRITYGDRLWVERLTKEFDEEAVRQGFIIARGEGQEKMSYVRGVAKKDFELRMARKSEAEGAKVKAVLNSPDFFEKNPDAEKWKGMFCTLLKKEEPVKESYRDTEDYKRKEALFNQELK